MRSMRRRLNTLEGQAGSREPVISAIVRCLVPPLSGMLSAALFFSNFQVGGIGQ